jgi:CRISPR-associated endonuclease Csn1
VAQIKKSGQILMAPVNEANVDGRNRDKNNDFKFTSKTAGSMQKSNSMIITISPIGKKIQK